jgi:hypothetical protein
LHHLVLYKNWTDLVVHVNGVRLCVWIAATSGPIVHIHEYGEPQWNDTDGKTEETREKPVPVPLSTTNPTWTDLGLCIETVRLLSSVPVYYIGFIIIQNPIQ